MFISQLLTAVACSPRDAAPAARIYNWIVVAQAAAARAVRVCQTSGSLNTYLRGARRKMACWTHISNPYFGLYAACLPSALNRHVVGMLTSWQCCLPTPSKLGSWSSAVIHATSTPNWGHLAMADMALQLSSVGKYMCASCPHLKMASCCDLVSLRGLDSRRGVRRRRAL